ncbi:uncharacterized protein EDB91DRAFT_1089765 [Suillus paluster]|uniref:uncharacterized protein n=1 Tax=Suillus paluster TaxID=48578 RepID=UPI001B86192D|nr:uncharacterized protein EDB91DRAFT_1089765 [Suillus paluster]KAG1718813.1 hypothetical protein EDB91DRAFT_1089765 [Suillus paluster]
MARHNHANSTSSSSSSESSAGSSARSEVSTHLSTPPPRISGKRGRDVLDASDKNGRKSKKASPVRAEKKAEKTQRRSRTKVLTPREQCIHIARWIPRGLDMFCNLKQTIQVSLLLEQEEEAEAEDGDEAEEEHIKAARSKILDAWYVQLTAYMRTLTAYMHTLTTYIYANIIFNDDITRARYKRTFEYVMEHAPYLGTLIGRRKKCEELAQLIGEMQNMINHTRSEDASRLKSHMGSYAAPNPDKELICPPITDDSKSRALMGFNHAQLGKLLCPVKYLVDYIEDPHGMKNKFDSATLKVTAALWPAFLYPGNTAGEDFDPEDIIEGLFRGYLLERVIKHIFTSPSSALKAGVSSGTRTCNAKLHGMKEVGAEHIAYAAVQARFAISSLEKWKDHDGLFYYTNFYTRIVNLIRGRKDEGNCSAMKMAPSLPPRLLKSQRASLPPSSRVARFPTPDPPVDSRKAQEVLPARPPTPNPPDNSHKRKQVSASALFDDNSPLTEEDEEITRPTKRKRKNAAVPPKKTPKRKASKK